MKKYAYLFFVLMTLLCCNSSKKYGSKIILDFEDEVIAIPFRYNSEDSVIISLEIYKANDKVGIVLDSIIREIECCSRINKANVCLNFMYDTICMDKPIVHISTVDLNYYTPAEANALFYYNNYLFYYKGEIIKYFFEATGRFEKIKAINPVVFEMLGIDDSQLQWRYILKDGDLFNSSYVNCNSSFWIDNNGNEIYNFWTVLP